MQLPEGAKDANSFVQAHFVESERESSFQAFLKLQLHFTGCIPRLFNISGNEQFLAYFEGIQDTTVQEMVGSIAGNLIDRPEVALVHLADRSAAYYARVEKAFAESTLNVNSLVECILERYDRGGKGAEEKEEEDEMEDGEEQGNGNARQEVATPPAPEDL